MTELIINAEKCTSCMACELVCSFAHEGVFAPALSRIKVIRFMDRGLNVPITCQQCEDAPCVAACPSGAMHLDLNLGRIGWDERKCIFCRMCTHSCPFGAVVYESPRRIIKCDLWEGEPVCVANCIYGALMYEPLRKVVERRQRATAKSNVPVEGDGGES